MPLGMEQIRIRLNDEDEHVRRVVRLLERRLPADDMQLVRDLLRAKDAIRSLERAHETLGSVVKLDTESRAINVVGRLADMERETDQLEKSARDRTRNSAARIAASIDSIDRPTNTETEAPNSRPKVNMTPLSEGMG